MKQFLTAVAAAVVLASCAGNANNAAAIEAAKKATIDSMNNVAIIKKQVADSINALHRHRTTSSYNENLSAAPAGNTAPVAATPAPAPKKKGWKSWSHTAKGAVVGAGAGAITGAIANPDRVKGAAIGAIIGTGVGAGTGAIVDHAKKKKQQRQ